MRIDTGYSGSQLRKYANIGMETNLFSEDHGVLVIVLNKLNMIADLYH